MLHEHFERCLNANYTHTREDGDYAIEVEDNVIYILFQWSNSWCDWMSNFNFPQKAYKNGTSKWHVHRGFLRVWKAMRDEIEAELDKLVKPDSEIVCIGYSHGAALALLCTEDMIYKYGNRVSGFGFGCPRVVWGKLPREVKTRLSNFVAVRNVPDIVTHVPPAIFGFHHETLFKIGKLGKYGPIKAHYPTSYFEETEASK